MFVRSDVCLILCIFVYISVSVNAAKKRKGVKLVPPSIPEINRLTEDSVMVRWSVPQNTGLPILFFKIQYKEVKGEAWMTVDTDIAPHIHSYAVTGLKTGATYRFRIAAVYSNNDNKASKKSANFTLLKEPPMMKPSSPPKLIHTSPVSPTAVLIKWSYVDIEDYKTKGFIIHYRAAHLASNYYEITVDGSNRMHVITHLLPDTAYDIKMQSFNVAGASAFSNITTSRTMKNPDLDKGDTEESNVIPNVPIPVTSKQNQTLLYTIIIAVGAVVLVFIVFIVVCIVRQKQSSQRPKTGEKGQHLTALSNEYTHSNGHCLSNNKSNGHLSNGISTKSLNMNGFGVHRNEESTEDCDLINVRVNALSQGTSMHHLNSNGKHFNDSRLLTSLSQTSLHNSDGRKSPFVDDRYPKLYTSGRFNGRVRSFTRLNGTLERKRKSRTDLVDTKECEPMLNRCNGVPMAPTNGPFVIMQSSC